MQDRLRPLRHLAPQTVRGLRGVFFDIDDTFTTGGRIPACAFTSLWDLKAQGLTVVPVTGRPAGWCDHIARMWPVDGVIGENGALYFWRDPLKGKLRKCFADPDEVRAQKRSQLAKIRDEILAAVPGSALASDQAYREADLAIDFCEDVTPLDRRAVARICRIFRQAGATCKVSSIHVNGWFGRYTKLDMVRRFVRERLGLDLDAERTRFAYAGDRPHDEPMFAYFPNSIGVANVRQFCDQMTHLPQYVTEQAGGEGFAEMSAHLLCHWNSKR